MVRYKIDGSPISVAYGHDDALSGTFLSVFDSRLKWQEEASDDVNSVAESVGVQDGGGSYFDLHTGQHGFGQRVSESTMRVYLARFGVPADKIDAVFPNSRANSSRENSSSSSSSVQTADGVRRTSCCAGSTSKACAKCKSICYCSRECQVADWPEHKLICSASPYPKKKLARSVYAILLAEDGQRAEFVELEVKTSPPRMGSGYCESLNTDKYISDRGSSTMSRNPIHTDRKMSDTLFIYYRDRFLNDGISEANRLVDMIVKDCKNPADWRGPIIITKGDAVSKDMQMKDFMDVADFFKWYSR